MTIPTFPTLIGLGFPVKKSPIFMPTLEHQAVSGASSAQSTQIYARFSFELPFGVLRSNSLGEQQTLISFFQGRRGKALPFHFADPDDNAIAGQGLGIGDGVTTQFGFVRLLGTIVDPLQDVDAGAVVKIDGVTKSLGSDYTLLSAAQYGTTYGIDFTSPPSNGAVITGDFSYRWLCRFDTDTLEFTKTRNQIWTTTLKFTSVAQ